MTEQEQRIAIAKWAGWTHIEDKSKPFMMDKGTYVYGYPPTGAIVGKKHELPEYTQDLNAMHEAESNLPTTKRHGEGSFAQWLWAVTENDVEGGSTWYMCHATAGQRAEALLRTLNLWTE